MKKSIVSKIIIIAGVFVFLITVSGCAGDKNDSLSNESNSAIVQDDIQTITTKITSNSYPPITVQKGIPVKWTLQADEADLNGCNNKIVITKYNIEKELVVGDNIIEFTPSVSGEVDFRCWMGMINSKIIVVDKLSNTTSKNTKDKTIVSKVKDSNQTSVLDTITKATISNDIQTISTSLDNGSYQPIIVQKGTLVKWTINAREADINGCNEKLFSTDFNINQKLIVGENVIEFVPDKVGTYVYTCWMGMVTSTISVVEDINNFSQSDIDSYQNSSTFSENNSCNITNSDDTTGGCNMHN